METKRRSTTRLLQHLKLSHAAESEMCIINLAFVNHCYSSSKIYLSFIEIKSIKSIIGVSLKKKILHFWGKSPSPTAEIHEDSHCLHCPCWPVKRKLELPVNSSLLYNVPVADKAAKAFPLSRAQEAHWRGLYMR